MKQGSHDQVHRMTGKILQSTKEEVGYPETDSCRDGSVSHNDENNGGVAQLHKQKPAIPAPLNSMAVCRTIFREWKKRMRHPKNMTR